MSKEEILTNKGECYEYDYGLIVTPYVDALNAMDEYAKQEALTYADWIFDNGWEKVWMGQDYLGWSNQGNYSSTITESELYNQYIKSKEQ